MDFNKILEKVRKDQEKGVCLDKLSEKYLRALYVTQEELIYLYEEKVKLLKYNNKEIKSLLE